MAPVYESLSSLGETDNPMRHLGDSEVRKLIGAQGAAASGGHPSQTGETGAEVRPSLGQETFELGL